MNKSKKKGWWESTTCNQFKIYGDKKFILFCKEMSVFIHINKQLNNEYNIIYIYMKYSLFYIDVL